MTRINRPDTLLTELRDLKRRLRLLEAARMRTGAATMAAAAARAAPGGVPLVPARTSDWPGTSSAGWERLLVTLTDRGGRLVVELAADPDTAGQARATVDGEPAGDTVAAPGRFTVEVAAPGGAEVEVAVEARRTSGTGLVRATARLQ